MVPEVVTHYYLAGRKPFLSLSELADAELDAVLADLSMLRDGGRQHRPFGPRYMHLRRLTEARLRELFIAAGGQPERTAPHYFVLGELAGLVEQFGLPDPAWDGDYRAWASWPVDAYIEVQLWSDEPIAEYLPS